MVTEVVVDTGLVLTVKVALVALPGTVTLAGTVATLVLLLERATTAPPLGAGPLSVTVPVEELPPVTLVGLRLSDESVGGAGRRAPGGSHTERSRRGPRRHRSLNRRV